MTPSLLVFSPDTDFVEQLRNRFSARYELVVAESLGVSSTRLESAAARAALAHLTPATLNGYSPQTFLNKLQQAVHSTPIYGLVDSDCPREFVDLATKTVRTCLPVPVDFDRLEQLLDNHSPLADELDTYCYGLPRRTLKGQSRSMVTFTPSMFGTFDDLEVAAAHDVTVLLIGETGSGKTFLAKMIHELSSRSAERCLTVACGALPPDLIESELFGYVKGAFTGADSDKLGKFAAAQNGTLLLDEIDVLAPEQQAKLLRVIETGEYEPVGSNETLTSNARLLVASNVDLEELVAAGRFRMDLYYRLNTLSFHLPPLRDRTWDIEYLAGKFAVDHGRTHNIELKRIDPEFLGALRQYAWPGNIRELENVIRRAVLYCREGVLAPGDLPSAIRSATKPSRNGVRNGHQTANRNDGERNRTERTLEERVGEIEHRIIEESLHRHNNHRTHTARELGISRVTLYNKMKKFGMMN
jgi:two-component system, NtrC family, response regulator AtoC